LINFQIGGEGDIGRGAGGINDQHAVWRRSDVVRAPSAFLTIGLRWVIVSVIIS
jgi:hypothetical protein